MKYKLIPKSFICLLAVSCSFHELETKITPLPEDDIFYASLESTTVPNTKVYIDENVKILWDAEDLISIFNKTTLNQKYVFTGDTGANAGYFNKVSVPIGTGYDLGFICAVYPYQGSTSISNSGVMTLSLPGEQSYRENSFGPGANTMVSATNDNLLKFKNVSGYLVLKFYGENVSVSSIKLEGNNDELLSGEATMTPAVGTTPTIAMASTAETSITLICDTPVELGATKDEASVFWMVVPPTDFSKGFKLTVTAPDGRIYVKETDKNLSVARNGVLRIAPIDVELSDPIQPNNIIYYTSTDGNIVTPTRTNVFGANIISNEYENGQGVISFDGDVTSIGEHAFYSYTTEGATGNLETISLPNSINSIGNFAFTGQSLKTISIPEGVKEIPEYCFHRCSELREVILPEGIERIGESAFEKATALTSVSFPSTLIAIDGYAFYDCSCLSVSIPDQLKSLGDQAFCRCIISDVIIPSELISIGVNPFRDCSINSISVNIKNPAYDSRRNCNAIIEKATAKVITGCKATTLPVGILSIGSRSFNVKGITSVTLPSSVKKLEFAPFYTDLPDLYCHPFNKPLGFGSGQNNIGSYGVCTLHVPKGCLNEYSFWGNKIQEIENRIVVDGSNIIMDKEYWKRIVAVKFTGTVTWNSIYWIFYSDYDDDDVYIPHVLECDFRDATFPAQIYSAIDSSGDTMFSGEAGENVFASGMFSYTTVQSIVLPSSIVRIENLNGYYGNFSFIEIPSSQLETISMAYLNSNPDPDLVLVCNATTPPSISVSGRDATIWALFVPSSALEAYHSSDWNRYFTYISSL